MIDKTVDGVAAAVAGIGDGATVMIGGFGSAGMPFALIDALLALGARELTLVTNNAGNGDTGLALLFREKRVRRILCSFPRQVDSWHFDALYRAGEVELELVPQGNLAERIRAAGAGIGAFFTPTGYGTPLAEGKETRLIDGRHHVLEHPIHADFALIRAQQGRPLGQSRLSQDGAQLRTGDGDGGPVHGRAGRRDRAAGRARSGSDRDARHLRPARRRRRRRRRIRADGRRRREGAAMNRLTREQMAARVGRDIPNGAYVNLGIGLPTLVANHLPADREIVLHTENGLLGMGPAPEKGREDPDLINAGKQPVTALTGASFFHHADSFAMMRGGHLDFCVLGAFQVSVAGDLANWHTGEPDAIPAVGGAMDLAIGARRVLVMMEHLTRTAEQDRRPLHLPADGVACVTGSTPICRGRRDAGGARRRRGRRRAAVRRAAAADRRRAAAGRRARRRPRVTRR